MPCLREDMRDSSVQAVSLGEIWPRRGPGQPMVKVLVNSPCHGCEALRAAQHLVKDLHRGVDDGQLQELLREILHPKVHRPRVQPLQGGHLEPKHQAVIQCIDPSKPHGCYICTR
jgi:hypothetical protein